MDFIAELVKKMCGYSNIDKAEVITDIVQCNGISKMKLRDHLIEIGTILEYDEESSVFVATINSGFGGRNPAIVGLILRDETLYIAAYAKEGFIRQGTAQKVIQKVLKLLV